MKKVISYMLLSAFISASLPVSAANEPSLDFLKASFRDSRYKSITQTGTLSGKLNKPLNILSELEEGFKNTPIYDIVDFQSLLEGLFDSSLSYEVKQKTENNGDKIACEMRMESGIPVIINPNLNIDVNTSYSVWAELDFAQKDTAVFSYIISTPMSRKYLTMNSEDFNSLVQDEMTENPMNAVWKMFDEDSLDEMSDRLIESIYQNAYISGDSSAVTITFSDIGLKKYIADIFDIAFSYYDEETRNELKLEESLAPIEEAMKKVPVFGNKALVLNCELDSQGRLANESFEMNVDVNLYDLISAFDDELEGITKADSALSFTLTGETEIKYDSVQINKPELTEENSISVTEIGNNYYEAEAESEEWYNRYPYVSTDENFYGSNGERYAPVRDVLETFSYDVTYDNGTITAAANSKYSEYDSIVLVIGDKTVKIGANTLTLEKAPFIIGERSYMLLSDVEKLMNVKAETYDYSPSDMRGGISFFRYAEMQDFNRVN